MAGLDRPSAGAITTDGRPALMFQEHALFPWLTAGKNIELALRLRGVAKAERRGKAVEINASPERLDLADVHARRAAELGIPIAISTDTHGIAEHANLAYGIAVARRAWIGPDRVLNARPLDQLLAWARAGR